ncbi:MAG: type IIL restriction-modification enzyme MmeI, partial [Solirubrobacterales bacterium]
IRSLMGDSYVEFLKREFGIGVKDFCVYWFRKAHDALEPGQRAGLVGTNSISQNRARSASLDYIVENGGVITDAVSTQQWPGEANVHVSIVNWVKGQSTQPLHFLLDGDNVEGITSSLRAGAVVPQASVLAQNKGKCFQGPIPVGEGFVLSIEEANELLAADDSNYSAVVRPFLTSEDIAKLPGSVPSRFIIDFAYLPLEEASNYPRALEIVRERVKPFRDTVNREGHRKNWWRFGEPRRGMRAACDRLDRFVAGTRHGKRIYFVWKEGMVLPSDATNVFAFEDDYSMGILTSRIHTEWARNQSSTLESRIRYTPSTAFMTFPWPNTTDSQRATIAEITKCLYDLRHSISIDRQVGLTTLYNQLEEGAFEDLRTLHDKLDAAVVEAYGWPKTTVRDSDETNRRLLELNRAIVAGEVAYAPFTSN